MTIAAIEDSDFVGAHPLTVRAKYVDYPSVYVDQTVTLTIADACTSVTVNFLEEPGLEGDLIAVEAPI